jgi:branched-chain amino acid transport system substrate-binding protein
LAKFDEGLDPTASVNNSRRLRDQYKAPAIFNPLFNSLAAIAKINQEKGNEFLVMAYTSTPKVIEIGNKLLTASPPPFTVYVKAFSDIAWEKDGARRPWSQPWGPTATNGELLSRNTG